MLRETTKNLDIEDKMRGDENIESMIDELNDIKNKYDELLHLYKRC
jgi:hypothetical protein